MTVTLRETMDAFEALIIICGAVGMVLNARGVLQGLQALRFLRVQQVNSMLALAVRAALREEILQFLVQACLLAYGVGYAFLPPPVATHWPRILGRGGLVLAESLLIVAAVSRHRDQDALRHP